MKQSYSALRQIINAALFDTMAKFSQTVVGKIAMKVENDGSQPYEWLGHTPRMVEMMGSLTKKALTEFTLTILNKKWAVGMDVDTVDFSSDKFGMYKTRIAEMANEPVLHPWERAMAFLLNGHDATYGLCYDGQYFFDTDHVDPGADYIVAQDNDLTANIADPAAPTMVELETAFNADVAALAGFVDDTGRIYHNDPDEGLMIVAPWHYRTFFRKLLKSEHIPGVAGGNVKNPNYEAAELHCDSRLTGNVYYLLKINKPTKPLILQFQKVGGKEWRVENTGLDSDNAINHDIVTYAVKGLYNFGYGQWRNAVRQAFT